MKLMRSIIPVLILLLACLLLGMVGLIIGLVGCAQIEQQKKINELINRFEEVWMLDVTGKAYWIGYTEDMHSIATYKDAAIQPLLEFIDRTKSNHTKDITNFGFSDPRHPDHAKHGAIFTIHLIGIESKIAGRFHEEFKSKKARDALLSLLSRENLQIPVLTLLIRDPWLSDVPHLLNILQKGTPHEWAFVKALQLYKVDSPPVHQELPKALAELECECELKKNYHKELIQKLSITGDDKFIIEPELLGKDLHGDVCHCGSGYVGGGFGYVLESLTACNYCYLESKIEYYYENDKVHLCSIETAKERWLKWWEENKDK